MQPGIGDRVRQLRRSKSFDQKDIARVLGIGSTSISHKECGHTQFSSGELVSLAKAFNVSLDYLITGKEATEDQITTVREQRLINTFRHLSHQAQTDLIEMALDRLLAESFAET